MEITLFRRPNHIKYYVKLVSGLVRIRSPTIFILLLNWWEWEARLSGEERFSIARWLNVFLHHSQQLSKDTTDSPYVDRGSVLLVKQDYFRGAVPPWDDVPRKLFSVGQTTVSGGCHWGIDSLDYRPIHIMTLLFFQHGHILTVPIICGRWAYQRTVIGHIALKLRVHSVDLIDGAHPRWHLGGGHSGGNQWMHPRLVKHIPISYRLTHFLSLIESGISGGCSSCSRHPLCVLVPQVVKLEILGAHLRRGPLVHDAHGAHYALHVSGCYHEGLFQLLLVFLWFYLSG